MITFTYKYIPKSKKMSESTSKDETKYKNLIKRAKILSKMGEEINLEACNPYQCTKLPTKKQISPFVHKLKQIGNQVGDQIWNQVGKKAGKKIWNQIRDQIRYQIWIEIRDQITDQTGKKIWNKIRDKTADQIGNQVSAASYWAINIHFDLGIHHWFGDYLKLGVMIISIKGKIKVFGKRGKYLGEYNEEDFR